VLDTKISQSKTYSIFTTRSLTTIDHITGEKRYPAHFGKRTFDFRIIFDASNELHFPIIPTSKKEVPEVYPHCSKTPIT